MGTNIVGGANTYGTIVSESIHDRQVQSLQPATQTQSVNTHPDQYTGNLRKALIDQIISYLAIVKDDISGLPVVTGAFAKVCRHALLVSATQVSQAQCPAVRGEELLGNLGMDIVVSPEQGKSLAAVMGRFLHKEKDAGVSSISGVGPIQEEKFHYLLNGTEFFSIRLLILGSPGNFDMEYHTYQLSDGKSVKLKTSLSTGIGWLKQQFAGLANNPEALKIIEAELQNQDIPYDEAWRLCPEILQWICSQRQACAQQVVSETVVYPDSSMPRPVMVPVQAPVPVQVIHQLPAPIGPWQSSYCPGQVPIVPFPQQAQPYVPMCPEEPVITLGMQPVRQEAADDQTGDLAISSTNETITPVALESGSQLVVLKNDNFLIKDIDAIQDLGFSLISDVFPSPESEGASADNQSSKVELSESKNESSGSSRRGKKNRRGANTPGRAANPRRKGNVRGHNVRGGDPFGFSSAMQALSKAVNNVAAGDKKTRFEKLSISDDAIGWLNDLLSTEKSARLVRRPFRHSSFLGKAQCYYVKQPEEGFTYSYKGLAGVIEKIVPELSETLKNGESSFESLNEIRAIIGALMLKYLVYMSKENHQMSSLLLTLSELIEFDCRLTEQYEAGAGSPVLKLLPQTFLVLLTQPEVGRMTFPVDVQKRLVSTFASILTESNRHGCYDISASIISSLHCLPLDSLLPDLNWSEASNLASQIQETFGYYHKLMHLPGASCANRLSIARSVIDLRDGLNLLKRKGGDHWAIPWLSPDSAEQDFLVKAINSAEKILDDDELVLKNESRELAQAKRKEQEEIRRKQAEARMKVQKANPQTEKPGSEIDQPEEQSDVQQYCLVTAPIMDTAVDAIKLQPSPWEKELARAVSFYKDGLLVDAEANRVSALKACKDKIDQACVWADCGNALLEPYQEVIARVVAITGKAIPIKRQIDVISDNIPDELVKKHGDAKNWLAESKYKIPKEESLLSLAVNLPSKDEMNSLLQVLKSTVDMYERAVELIDDCSVLQLRDTGDFILHIMESDLKSLFDQQEDLLSVRQIVASAMTGRSEIMKQLGFYGSRSEQRGSKAREETISYQKSVYTETRERLSKEALQLDFDQADLTKWDNLMNRIGQLRIKSAEG
ncbi:hypothetical protein [Endozoicomonas atrinae]|uniref:hypothetical protein n=1 Tax=Endozoicomonas atrinae TaxID=1333660 RepID=UPI003AFFE940